MHAWTRRDFIKVAGTEALVASMLAGGASPLGANPLGLPIGSQTWPHRAMIKDGNFAGLAATMSGLGVSMLEMCSPLDYEEFAGLTDGKQVKKVLADHGLGCISAHFGMNELRKRQSESLAWAHDVGITQIITATLGAGEQPDARRREARGGRVQQDRGGHGEGRHAAGPPQRGLRALGGRTDAAPTTSSSSCSIRSS